MSDKNRYDVIIVGCGPGGAHLGYLLSSKGLKILIIEKKSLPRYKACGGGLTKKAVDILPFDISEVVEDYSHTAVINIENKPVFVETFDKPIITMVMRDKFDHFLAKKAIEAGAVVHENTTFKALSGSAGNLTVEAVRSNGSVQQYKTRLIVGADGIHSKVAKCLGFLSKPNLMIAIEGEVFHEDPHAVEKFKNSVCFDFGVIPKGYGWVFPKSSHLSMGVLTYSKKIKSLKHYLNSYIKSKDQKNGAETRTVKGHLIPCMPCKNSVFADDRGLLVGDAAGFTDPVTGEGIYFALKGALIASEVIVNAVESGHKHMELYNILLNKEFLKELTYAKRLGHLLYNHPRLVYKVLRSHGGKLGKYHLEIISGKSTYEEVYKKMFNIFKLLPLLLKKDPGHG
jgi:geranylgeranyl reductase family protein